MPSQKVMALRMSTSQLIGAIALSAALLAGAGPAHAVPAFGSDDKGFVNSAARCDANQTALAIG